MDFSYISRAIYAHEHPIHLYYITLMTSNEQRTNEAQHSIIIHPQLDAKFSSVFRYEALSFVVFLERETKFHNHTAMP
jgi:hypothetical protein